MPNLLLDVRLVDEYGNVHAALRLPVPQDCAFIGWRPVDEMRAGARTLNDAVCIMQTREVRRSLLAQFCQQAGERIADFLEDREGWHGIDRQKKGTALTAAEEVRTSEQVFRNDRDIVERLRELSDPEIDAGIPIMLEAANEIERLRKVIAAEPTSSLNSAGRRLKR